MPTMSRIPDNDFNEPISAAAAGDQLEGLQAVGPWVDTMVYGLKISDINFQIYSFSY